MYIIAKMRSFFQVTHCRNSAYNSMRKHKGSYMDLNQNVNENVDTGTLRIHLTNESNGTPVQGAKISISYTGNPSQTIEEVSADDSGNSE